MPEVVDMVDYAVGQRRAAIGSSIMDLDEDPDKAARAIKLGNDTGVPPVLISRDLEGFERQHKVGIVNNILNDNEYLRDWVRDDPMASKVAADDWGQLDRVSQALGPLQIDQPSKRVLKEAAKGFYENITSALGASEPKFAEEYERSIPYFRTLAGWIRLKSDLLGAIVHGGLGAAASGGAQVAREFGADEGTAGRFGREAASFAEFMAMDMARHGGKIDVPQSHAIAQRFNQAMQKAEPWLNQGKKPPVGTDPLIDRMYAEQARFDAESIDAILDEAHKSLVRERSPEVFVNLIKKHIGEKPMSIPYDAVKRLYGDKVPAPGDGMLGDVPDFARKYEEAAAAGGSDITIPTAEYVGRVEPEVHKALKDEIRPDPAGMNNLEAKGEDARQIELPGEEPKTLSGVIKDGAALNQITPVLLEEGQPEKSLFGKMALGLPKPIYDKWMSLIERDSAQERAWELRKALEEQIKRRGKEWREAETELRPQVASEVSDRPEWVAHDWFDGGVLRGTQGEKPTLDPKYLTPEQRKALPKKYLEEGGSNPDDLANVAGFKTGDEMVDVMGRFYKEKGELSPTDYLERVVRNELETRIEDKIGKPDEQVISEAQDHVTGITALERLHEQTVAFGLKAGEEITFTKESIGRAARGEVGRRRLGEQSKDYYLAESGKAGRAMIQAFLKQDWTEAFRQSQRQYMANLMAKEMGKVEKTRAKFIKDAKRFYKSEVEGYKNIFGGPYVPFIQEILQKMGREIDRTSEQLADAINQGGYKDLEGFVEAKRLELREIDVPDYLLDNKVRPIESMSVDQFREGYDGLRSLINNGRDEGLIYKEGQAHTIEEIIEGQMVDRIKELRDKKINIADGKGITAKKGFNYYYAQSLTAESMLNRIDRDNPKGAHNQFVVRALSEAANHEARLIRFYQKALVQAAGDIADIDKKVENSLWKDPEDGVPYDMKKRNVLGILAYWGNPSSRKKLLEGYGIDEATALKWLTERTTKEDWDRMQRIGSIFKRLIKEADKMSMELHGQPIKKIEITPFTTLHGRYSGWYNPVKYDPLHPGKAEVKTGEKVLEGEGYRRATTSQAYTKERTEYVSQIEMNLDVIPSRINQMIHDIAFRPAIIQASKVFYNPKWRRAMIRHYGPEYERQFIPMLEDVANYSNRAPDLGNMIIEHFRQNVIATLIGFNPNTVMKHGMTAAFNSMREVGSKEWLKQFASMAFVNEKTGTKQWSFAINRSEELQRRMRSWTDLTLKGQPEVSLRPKSIRETFITLGSTPVAVSDLLSAVPTWLAGYEKALRAGEDEAMAAFMGDRAVRRAHGSSAITNLPNIMRTNALGRTFTSLYGFFSHMLQKQYELAWKARDSYVGIRAGDFSAAKKYSPDLLWGFISYVIIPAVVEELVTPYVGHEKDSWGKKAAKTMTQGFAASYIGPKDFVHSFMNAADPSTGLISTAFKIAGKAGRDLSRGEGMWDRRHAGKTIADFATLAGALTGMSTAQVGRSLQFMQRYNAGLEHPHGPFDWMQGFRKGTMLPPGRRL